MVGATSYAATSQLVATGAVSPDVSRTVPVVSMAAGRVVEIHARLGDTVTEGQLLLRVRSSDISGASSDYRKAVSDEVLSHTQLDRAQGLYDHGAISLNDLQVAQDTEDKAKVDVETRLKSIFNCSAAIRIIPRTSWTSLPQCPSVITDQQVTNAAGVQGLGSELHSRFQTCPMFGFSATSMKTTCLQCAWAIRRTSASNALSRPQVLKGTIGNIGAVLDPNLRTAKVRIEVRNPGIMRLGMFVTATFHGLTKETHAAVPASAILHLHDRDWVFVSAAGNQFHRIEVVGGETLPNNMQEIVSGIQPGQSVVSNALELENALEQ